MSACAGKEAPGRSVARLDQMYDQPTACSSARLRRRTAGRVPVPQRSGLGPRGEGIVRQLVNARVNDAQSEKVGTACYALRSIVRAPEHIKCRACPWQSPAHAPPPARGTARRVRRPSPTTSPTDPCPPALGQLTD